MVKAKVMVHMVLGKVRVIQRVTKERLTVRDIVMEKEKETKERVTKERAKTKVSTQKETIGTVGTTHLGTRKVIGIRIRTTRMAIRM